MIPVEVLPDPVAAARRAAEFIAERARQALRERGRFVFALSGGHTPLPMYEALAHQSLRWQDVEMFQADERVAPAASPARNWSNIARLLIARAGPPAPRACPMPTDAPDLAEAATRYARTLAASAGSPPILDLIHLGLGADGHTASLFAGDAALEVDDAWVAPTGVHHGHRRMTLTLPTIAHARCVLWLVCGEDKAAALERLLDGDETLPAGRVPRDRAGVVADLAARPAARQP
jgi:6-phosphogluconolactonase